jgi:hypothetical protein
MFGCNSKCRLLMETPTGAACCGQRPHRSPISAIPYFEMHPYVLIYWKTITNLYFIDDIFK